MVDSDDAALARLGDDGDSDAVFSRLSKYVFAELPGHEGECLLILQMAVEYGHLRAKEQIEKMGAAWQASIDRVFALRMVVERMQFRIDAMNEKELPGVSISKGFAAEIVAAAKHGAMRLEALNALIEAPRDD